MTSASSPPTPPANRNEDAPTFRQRIRAALPPESHYDFDALMAWEDEILVALNERSTALDAAEQENQRLRDALANLVAIWNDSPSFAGEGTFQIALNAARKALSSGGDT